MFSLFLSLSVFLSVHDPTENERIANERPGNESSHSWITNLEKRSPNLLLSPNLRNFYRPNAELYRDLSDITGPLTPQFFWNPCITLLFYSYPVLCTPVSFVSYCNEIGWIETLLCEKRFILIEYLFLPLLKLFHSSCIASGKFWFQKLSQ